MNKLFLLITIFLMNYTFAKSSKAEEYKKINLATEYIFTDPKKAIDLSNEVIKNNTDYSLKNHALGIKINAQLVLLEYQSVIENSKTAIELSKKNNDVLSEIKYLSMLGNLYQSLFYNEKAKYYLNLAESKIENQKLTDDILFIKANLYTVKGIIFRSELNSEFALKYFLKAKDVFSTLPKDNSIELNKKIIDIQIGFCDLALGNIESSKIIFNDILNYNDDNLGYNKYFGNIGLAMILLQENKNNQAIEILNKVPIHKKNIDVELKNMVLLEQTNAYLANMDLVHFTSANTNYLSTLNQINKNQENIINKMINDSDNQTALTIKNNRILNCILILFLTIIYTLLYLYFFSRNSKV